MPNNPRKVWRVAFVSMLFTIAAFGVAGWSFYNGHRNACQARNSTLDVLRDVITIATTPRPGQVLTPDQSDQLKAFQTVVYNRIDQARC